MQGMMTLEAARLISIRAAVRLWDDCRKRGCIGCITCLEAEKVLKVPHGG